jgi:hypothetical protein
MKGLERAKVFRRAGALALALAPVSPAFGSLTLPGGDGYLNGAFDEINYRATGVAYVTPLLYVGDLGSTKPPDQHDLLTALTYGYTAGGLGTTLFTVRYSIRNDDDDPFTGLRFMVNVQPDGSGSLQDNALVFWGAQAAGDPDQYQVATVAQNLQNAIVLNNTLNDSNSCAGVACNVDFALQWNLAQLDPGLEWVITVGLSDDGTALSTRYLQAASSADPSGTVLTFSGSAAVVPVPAAGLLLASALVGLGGLARRQRDRTGGG